MSAATKRIMRSNHSCNCHVVASQIKGFKKSHQCVCQCHIPSLCHQWPHGPWLEGMAFGTGGYGGTTHLQGRCMQWNEGSLFLRPIRHSSVSSLTIPIWLTVVEILSTLANCNFHAKNYHPANLRIFFLGDNNMEECSSLMDNYLSEFEEGPESKPGSVVEWQQKTFEEPNWEVHPYPARWRRSGWDSHGAGQLAHEREAIYSFGVYQYGSFGSFVHGGWVECPLQDHDWVWTQNCHHWRRIAWSTSLGYERCYVVVQVDPQDNTCTVLPKNISRRRILNTSFQTWSWMHAIYILLTI